MRWAPTCDQMPNSNRFNLRSVLIVAAAALIGWLAWPVVGPWLDDVQHVAHVIHSLWLPLLLLGTMAFAFFAAIAILLQAFLGLVRGKAARHASRNQLPWSVTAMMKLLEWLASLAAESHVETAPSPRRRSPPRPAATVAEPPKPKTSEEISAATAELHERLQNLPNANRMLSQSAKSNGDGRRL